MIYNLHAAAYAAAWGMLGAAMLWAPFGWLGTLSAIGPALGVAVHVGWTAGRKAGCHG